MRVEESASRRSDASHDDADTAGDVLERMCRQVIEPALVNSREVRPQRPARGVSSAAASSCIHQVVVIVVAVAFVPQFN
jgi:hypothetical protein